MTAWERVKTRLRPPFGIDPAAWLTRLRTRRHPRPAVGQGWRRDPEIPRFGADEYND
jgi:hypothetical protein